MLLHIPKVLSAEDLAECRRRLDEAEWVDGRGTAGHLSRLVKNNVQLRWDHPVARALGELIMDRLEAQPDFMAAALPHKFVPPLFNRYAEGQNYGPHVDGSIRPVEGTPHRVRTDLSATLFLSEPEDYDGGDLVIEDGFGQRRIKLPAGDLILYPGTSVHHVEPVTRGGRFASFFWIQSMVRDDADRTLLFQLDQSIRQIGVDDLQRRAATVQLTNVYHNLIRRWADT